MYCIEEGWTYSSKSRGSRRACGAWHAGFAIFTIWATRTLKKIEVEKHKGQCLANNVSYTLKDEQIRFSLERK